ncbi:MAG: FAD-dependent oxidoreductase [Candidatus Izemoplasmatales bacterium]
MRYDVCVIGAGLSGLTAAALLAKRGLKVAVIDRNYMPGGSCGVFKRDGATFDYGSSMLYGWGPSGFNPHRFVMNSLEEPISMIKHDLLYCVVYDGRRINFWADLDRFADELGEVFPSERRNILRFYADMGQIYRHVMVETPTYTSPEETDPKEGLKSLLRHPLSYFRFLSYLNLSADTLLRRYFKDPAIFRFFDKLTSTYCYTTVKETPAILAAVMFVDNHVGGSYYPAGSTLQLVGRLEKSIEEHGGTMMLEREAVRIAFDRGRATGVELAGGGFVESDEVVHAGSVWNFYGRLVRHEAKKRRIAWAERLEPTYPSVMLYALVDAAAIPQGTLPVEMLVGNPARIDETEVTVYVPSIDDRTLCPSDAHVVMAIGPSFETWDRSDPKAYAALKTAERARLLEVLERRFPGIAGHVRHAEVGTPATIERYAMKRGGAVAGPKQRLGQHMFRRLHIRTEWKNVFACGESTVMGTGTPAVTTSGLSAANAILRKRGLPVFRYDPAQKNVVRIVPHPFTEDRLNADVPEPERTIMRQASRCRFCEHPTCVDHAIFDVRGMNRRVAVGNFAGARRLVMALPVDPDARDAFLRTCESRCVLKLGGEDPVAIGPIALHLTTPLREGEPKR